MAFTFDTYTWGYPVEHMVTTDEPKKNESETYGTTNTTRTGSTGRNTGRGNNSS